MERANRRGQQFVTKEKEEAGWRYNRGRWTWVITRSTLFCYKSPNTLHGKKGRGGKVKHDSSCKKFKCKYMITLIIHE